jgi:hypothetical protein
MDDWEGKFGSGDGSNVLVQQFTSVKEMPIRLPYTSTSSRIKTSWKKEGLVRPFKGTLMTAGRPPYREGGGVTCRVCDAHAMLA